MFDNPYMPLYFGDVLRRTLYWTGEERALLLLLSAAQWCSGPLPRDLTALANALQYDVAAFRKLWDARVHTLFTETPAGFIDEDLETRRENVARLSDARRAAGQASGKVRRARAEQTSNELLEQNSERGVRANQRTNGRAVDRTPIQTNPNQSKPSEENQQADPAPSPPESDSADPPPTASARKARPRQRRLPADHPIEPLRAWAAENTPRVNFDAEIAMLRDHEFRDAHNDWDAVIRNWLRRASKQPARSSGQNLTRFEMHKRRLYGEER